MDGVSNIRWSSVFSGIILAGVLCLYANSGFAQHRPVKKKKHYSFNDSIPNLEEQLVSLDTLIGAALKNSPYLKYDGAIEEGTEQDLKLAKRRWQNYIGATASYNKGSQRLNLFGGAPDISTTAQPNNLLNGYRYGVNLSIPLSEFTSRKVRIKQSQSQLDAAKYRTEQTEMELRRQVVFEYNKLISYQKILKTKIAGKENSALLHQLAEKRLREGTISLEEYGKINELMLNSEVAYETAKSDFITLYLQFEELIGLPLVTLMKKI